MALRPRPSRGSHSDRIRCSALLVLSGAGHGVSTKQQARRGRPGLSSTIRHRGRMPDGVSLQAVVGLCQSFHLIPAMPGLSTPRTTGISETIAPASSSMIRWKSLAFSDG